VTRSFTLNLGVRCDYFQPPTKRDGNQAKCTLVHDGLLHVQLPAQASTGELSILRA